MSITTKALHTPGPWTLRRQGLATDDAYTVERLPDDGLRSVVAEIREMWLCAEHGGSAEANARLIAKAPEMRQLLADISHRSGWPLSSSVPSISRSDVEKVRALLAELP